MVGAQRADEVELVAAGDTGHLGAPRLGDLDRERADVARRAVDQHPVARPDRPPVAAAALHREHRGVRQCRGVLERHAVRDRRERPLRRADVLGERAGPEREHVAEDPVAGSKRVTPGPIASTTPATSSRARCSRGARRPMNSRANAGSGRGRPGRPG